MDPLNDLSTLKSCLTQRFITFLHFFLSQEHQHLALSFTNKIFIQTHGKVFFRRGREVLVQIEMNQQILKGELGQKSHLKKMAPVLTILSNARVRLNLTVYQNLWSADTTDHPAHVQELPAPLPPVRTTTSQHEKWQADRFLLHPAR